MNVYVPVPTSNSANPGTVEATRRAPVGVVVERIGDRDHRRAEAVAQFGEQPEPASLVAPVAMAGTEPDPAGGGGGQRLDTGGEACRRHQPPPGGHRDQDLALGGL